MAKLNTVKADATRHVMVFGPPKSGKTKLVGELAKHFNLIWFDLEKGYATLFQLPPEQQAKIELVHIPDNRGNPMAIETMLKVIKGQKVVICEKHGKVACPLCTKDNAPALTIELNALDNTWCVVLDSATQLTNSALANITKLKPVDYKLERDDWGNLGKLMDTFYSYVQTAPFNMVVISHETEVTMNDGKDKLVPTAGSSNFSRNSAKYFDDVVYLSITNGKHVSSSSTTAKANILTGTRADVDISKDERGLIALWEGK